MSKLKGFFGKAALAGGLVLGLLFAAGQVKALTIQELRGNVLGDQTYQTVTVFKAGNLTLSATPHDFDPGTGKWNYKITWNRMARRSGSIYINGNSFVADASLSGDSFTGYTLDPETRYRIVYYSAANGRGVRIVNRYFKTLSAQEDITDTEDADSAPTISYLNPASGPVGTVVKMAGSGFLSSGNKVKFSLGSVNANFIDSNTISFVVPFSMSPECNNLSFQCPQSFAQITPGDYSITVTNANGISNALNFSVISGVGNATTTATTTLTVLSPNGGEQWETGKTYAISYFVPDLNAEPAIYLERGYEAGSGKTGVNSSLLIGQPGRGVQSFSYTVPLSIASWPGLGGNYKVKVCTDMQAFTSSCASSDSSDAPFSVVSATTSTPSLTVFSPNGGERIQTGTVYTIKWQAPSNADYVVLSLFKGNTCVARPDGTYILCGQQVNMYALSYDNAIRVPNTGSYNWTVSPQIPAGDDYHIAVGTHEIGNPSPGLHYISVDSSNAPFSIVSNTTAQTPTITSISPNSGQLGTVIAINGSGFGINNNLYVDNNITAITSANGATTQFPIQNLSLGQHSFRVQVNNGQSNMPISNMMYFTVTTSSVSVTPTSLSFTAQAGGSSPAAQTIYVNTTSSWTAQLQQVSPMSGNPASWLSLPVNSSGYGSGVFYVGVAGPFATGTYSGNIVINTGYNNPSLVIPVTLTVTSSTSALPDFMVGDMDISPKLANASNAIEINKEALVKFTIKNQGGSALRPSFEILYIGGLSPISSNFNIAENTCNSLSQLSAGQSCIYATKVVFNQLSTPSAYGSMRMNIDPLNSIAESDETNNWGVINFDVRSANSVPTLTSITPNSGPAGVSVTITGTDLGLLGQTTTVKFGTTVANFGLGTGQNIQSVIVPNLPAGNYPVTVQVGPYLTNAVYFTVY